MGQPPPNLHVHLYMGNAAYSGRRTQRSIILGVDSRSELYIYFSKHCVECQGPKYIGNHEDIVESYVLQYFTHISLRSLIASKYTTLTMTIILSASDVGSLKVSANASISSLTYQGRERPDAFFNISNSVLVI